MCMALNSNQPYYCQILIISTLTHKGINRKSMKAISPNDCPPSSENVKLSLAVREITWTKDNSHILVQYESNCVALMSRAGQWVRILNPMNAFLPKKIIIPKVFAKLPKNAERTFTLTQKFEVYVKYIGSTNISGKQ